LNKLVLIFRMVFKQTLLAGFVFFYFSLAAQSNQYYQSGTYFFSTTADFQLNSRLFQPVQDSNIRTFLYIYGINAACVTFEFPYHGLYETRFLERDSLWVITLPFPDMMRGDTTFQRGFWIYASAPVSVYQVMGSKHPTSGSTITIFSESTVLAPMVLHDTLVPFGVTSVSQGNIWSNIFTDFTEVRVASDADGNELVLHLGNDFAIGSFGLPSNQWIIYPFDTTLTYILNRGELRFFISQPRSFRQVNHTRIYSANQKPFRIWANTYYANCTNSSMDSEIVEDVKPERYGGQLFHVAPLVEQPCRIVSLMALEAETRVFIDGSLVRTLNRMDRMDTCISGAVVVSSNKNILGYEGKCNMHSASIFSDGANGWSVTLSSDAELMKESYFSTIIQPDTGVHYYLRVVTKTNHLSLLRLNGVPVSPSLFDPFPTDPLWSYANLRIAPGFYKLQSDSGFHAIHFTHYPFPVGSAPSTHPIYGHNLAESVHWPADSFYFRVGYQPQSLVPFDSLAPSVCVGESVYFQPGHMRHRVWLYDFDDGNQLVQAGGNQLAPVVSHSWQTPGRYLVVITDTSGCYPPDSIWVEVKPGAQNDYEATVSRSCEGNQVFLSYNGESAAQIQWSWPGGSATTRQVSFDHDGSDTSLAVQLVTSLAGCQDTIAFTLSIANPDFAPELLPNVVTPNGDGVNDELCIPNARGYAACFRLEVFNRWGSRVFETDDPDQCWSPGNLPAGVYFYVIEVGAQSYKRSVTVVR
jgi:gliding motility-associated-like protein